MAVALAVGFLGAGRMATALARGFLKAGLVTVDRLAASDVSAAAREAFQRETGAAAGADSLAVVGSAAVIILAVKPPQVLPLVHTVREGLTDRHLLISIAAGVPLAKLEAGLPLGSRVVRVMPNTPALVGAGATAFALGAAATRDDAELTRQLFGSVGLAFEVAEPLLDAVTGVSGSGPAYACLIIEALSDGGVAAGLPREMATQLAAQTLLGTARLVLDTGRHPGALKDMVTSPGGTTIEGLHELEKAGVRGALITAVRAAAAKARQLGQQ
jgi:pyrroline-5-carboxylate reductase